MDRAARVLAIDTSTAWGSVAVIDADGLVAERAAHVPAAHLEWLIPAIDALLTDARLTRDSIGGLVVSRGPGGFSGLRIGIATAAAWAHSLGLPLVGVPTLEVIAAGVETTGLVLAALDARRGEIAGALFRRGDRIERLTPDQLLRPETIRDRLPSIETPTVLAGDALEHYAQALLDALRPWAIVAPTAEWRPRAAVAGAIGRARLLRGDYDDPLRLVPHYVRHPDAREFAP
jgi:tRNA threonylcarbamoyladenosine biosynthesis protein TsaB